MKILAYDVETGGLSPRKHSLLTLYCGVFTPNVVDGHITLELQSELDLKIKPPEGEYYQVTAGALKVNKIDLVKHDLEAMPLISAAEKFYYFLQKESNDGRDKLIPAGHNEPFDRSFVLENLLRDDIWNKFVGYHSIDTVPLAKLLQISGIIPKYQKLNLKALADYFNCAPSNTDWHTSKSDTLAHVKILECMINLLKTYHIKATGEINLLSGL